jgi:hypothetical protein
MNKFMIILSVWGLIVSGIVAEDARDAVRDEILKSVDAVEQARQDAINELRETVRDVECARAMREGEQNIEETSQIKVVESQAIAEIKHSTELLEKMKIKAKETIAKAVAEVKKVQIENGTVAEVETAKRNAVQTIAEAVSSVEVTKAETAKVIIEETGKVELSKIEAEPKPIHNESAVIVVKKVSVVESSNERITIETVKVLKLSDVNEMSSQKDKIKSSYPTKFIRFNAK